MKLSPGDTVQLIVTVGGVAYAKTLTTSLSRVEFGYLDDAVLIASRLLTEDVEKYADEAAD